MPRPTTSRRGRGLRSSSRLRCRTPTLSAHTSKCAVAIIICRTRCALSPLVSDLIRLNHTYHLEVGLKLTSTMTSPRTALSWARSWGSSSRPRSRAPENFRNHLISQCLDRSFKNLRIRRFPVRSIRSWDGFSSCERQICFPSQLNSYPYHPCTPRP
jgi:hypothetical protein